MNLKIRIILFFCLVNWLIYPIAFAEEEMPGNFTNPAAVKEVLSGKRTVANAAWWGFNQEDSTDALQGAINSGASKVIVPYTGSAWIVRPINLVSNLELIFEPGVVVIAKKGEFKGKRDCLFETFDKNNITLTGYGATLSMRKADYMRMDYAKSEYRNVLSFHNCNDIKILGLTLRDSGGDGIYIGDTVKNRRSCKNILVRDCVCDNNYRQGVSVICAENLLIENCIFKNTAGTKPSAGIDLEPNHFLGKFANVVISNCISENNDGPGFLVYLSKLSRESEDVSILFVNCYVKSGKQSGIHVGVIKDDGPKGLIEFRNCTIENIDYTGAYIYDKSVDSALVRFTNCKWRNVGIRESYSRSSTSVPIYLLSRNEKFTGKTGGIEFVDCYVYDKKDRPVITFTEHKGNYGIHNIKGNIMVDNPFGAKLDLGTKTGNIELDINTPASVQHQ